MERDFGYFGNAWGGFGTHADQTRRDAMSCRLKWDDPVVKRTYSCLQNASGL
jgi:hypothetical protein